VVKNSSGRYFLLCAKNSTYPKVKKQKIGSREKKKGGASPSARH
jgi:hypothetical protein